MKLSKIIILVLLFIVSTSVYPGNDTRTGTAGAAELLFSPTISSNGMGEVGVSLVDDKTFYFNPGVLGLLAMENKISFSGYPGVKKILDLDFYSSSISFPLKKWNKKNNKFTFGVGFYYSKLSNLVEESSMDYPDGSGRFFEVSFKNYNLVLAGGYSGRYDLGFGLNFKLIKEDIFDVNTSGYAFDFGVIARKQYYKSYNSSQEYQWLFVPAFGISYSNLGPEMGFSGIGFDQTVNNRPFSPSSSKFELPSVWRYGISCKIGVVRDENNEKLNIITLTPSIEREDLKYSDGFSKLGLELNLINILYVRTGKINLFPDANTWGLSISSRGFFKMFYQDIDKLENNPFASLVSKKMEIRYSYAKNSFENDYLSAITYHELILNIFL